MRSRSAMLLLLLLAAPLSSGCFTRNWTRAMDEITFRDRGPPAPQRAPYQPFGQVTSATVAGAAADFFRVPDLLVLDGTHRAGRDMVVVVPRGDPSLPALLLTPGGSRGSPLDRAIAAKAAGCWRDGGFNPPVEAGAAPTLAAMLVVERGEEGVSRRAAEWAPDRPWPRGEGMERAVKTVFSPFMEKPTPWTLVAVELGQGGLPSGARIAAWEPAGPEGPGRWRWGARRPVLDCLRRSSAWPRFWKGAGYVATVPLDIVTFPLQVVLDVWHR